MTPYVGPAPEPVPAAWVGDRRGESPRITCTGDQQPDALAGMTRGDQEIPLKYLNQESPVRSARMLTL